MTESMKKKFEELNMTRDEIERFSEAMKKEEFRKLLIEYAEEISDPKNRETYEREIRQLESERGSDVTFIHPAPGFCVKTTQNGDKKCFVNICHNEQLAKPSSSRRTDGGQGGQSGLMWQIPHTCSQPRDDVDKGGKKACVVYDVVFHPDAYRMGETNRRFQRLLIDSALETIEKSFGVRLDAVNASVLKHLNFKGQPTASIIRKPLQQHQQQTDAASSEESDPLSPLIDQIKKEYLDNQQKLKSPAVPAGKKSATTPRGGSRENRLDPPLTTPVQNEDARYTVPKYRILHRGQVDLEDYAAQVDNMQVSSTRPKEIVVSVELPLCKSAAGVNLDIFETTLSLESTEPSYKLELKLPYPVRSKEGKAKFDKSKRALSVTLPVVPFVERIEPTSSNSRQVPSELEDQSLSSSSSSLSNDDDAEATVSSQHLSAPAQVPVVKRTLPKKMLVKETKNHIALKYFVPNYERHSVQITVESPSQFALTCESTSGGGYVQYFSTHVHFYFIKSISGDAANDTFAYNVIAATQGTRSDLDPSDLDLKVTFVNDELFEVKLRKQRSSSSRDEDEIEAKKVRVSVDRWGDAESHHHMVLDVVQELNVDEDMLDASSKRTTGGEQLSHMSKKDFILNFNKLANENDAQDADIDEDDVEEDRTFEAKKAAAAEPSKDETKKMSNAEFAKFKELKEARKAQQQQQRGTCEVVSKAEKIDEVPENDDDNDEDGSDQESDENVEKKYLAAADHNDDDDLEEEAKGRQRHSGSLSSSSSSSTNGLASSLKGILKKPRSVSESESGALVLCHSMSAASTTNSVSTADDESGSCSGSGGDNGTSLSGSKKCVSFNKQVIRNVFKPGSTIAGMKKPNANKNNKKKNKRKRTISDPSHDAAGSSFRSRSVSESSDDSSSAFSNSCESLPPSATTAPAPAPAQQQPAAEGPSQKKKKKNKKKQQQQQPASSEQQKTKFDMQTMLEWKNQGRLPNDGDQELAKPTCAIKFKNKIMNDLEE